MTNTNTTRNTSGVERAVAALAPRWTSWITQTLQNTGPLVPNDLWRGHLPFVKYPTLIARLKQMGTDGLLQPRAKNEPVALSRLGGSLRPVHTSAADWSRRHSFFDQPVPEAERTEDALRRLNRRNLVATLGWVAENPGTAPTHIAEALGISYISTVYRLDQLVADGLLQETGRTANRRGTVQLTAAGNEVPDVLADIAAWAEPPAPAPRPKTAATATVRQIPRTAAALRRSPARTRAPAEPLIPTFSHVETVRPWTRPPTVPHPHGR